MIQHIIHRLAEALIVVEPTGTSSFRPNPFISTTHARFSQAFRCSGFEIAQDALRCEARRMDNAMNMIAPHIRGECAPTAKVAALFDRCLDDSPLIEREDDGGIAQDGLLVRLEVRVRRKDSRWSMTSFAINRETIVAVKPGAICGPSQEVRKRIHSLKAYSSKDGTRVVKTDPVARRSGLVEA